MNLPPDDIETAVFEQVRALARVATAHGAAIVHVKPHGALYNQAVNDPALARAIANGVGRFSRDVVLVALAGTPMLDLFRDAGFTVAAEAFADRMYEPGGTLRSRKFEDALIRDPRRAGEQALRIVQQGTVIAVDGSSVPVSAQTICIHGDTPGAPKVAAAVARMLRDAGVELQPLGVSGARRGLVP